MDATSLIGQDAYATGLQKQAAAQTGAVQGTAGKKPDLNKVHDAAQKFEAFFIGQMMEHMTAGIETDPTFGGGHGEDMWKSMLNQEYGKEIAKSGSLGIADHVMKGMLQMQEQRTAAAQAAAAPVIAASATTESDFTQQDAAIALVAGVRTPQKR